MQQTLPCDSLASDAHGVLAQLSAVKNHRSLVNLNHPKLEGVWTPAHKSAALLELEDQDFILRLFEESVLVIRACPHLSDSRYQLARSASGSSIVPKALGCDLIAHTRRRGLSRSSEWMEATGMEESVPSYGAQGALLYSGAHGAPLDETRKLSSVYLAKFYFPALCKKHHLGYFGGAGQNWQAMSNQISRWQQDGVTLEFIRDLMDEFPAHPEWCKAGRPPWIIFLRHKEELAHIVTTRAKKLSSETYRHQPGRIRPSIRATVTS